jgi:GT2 family glycosyltransferase
MSVVVPTIGRAALLEECIASIAACSPPPDEILVVDQSGDPAVAAVVARFEAAGARLLVATFRDRSLAVNLGMREARHELVAVTDDDCVVDPSWIERASEHLGADVATIVTGRVLPLGEAVAVPSLVGTDQPCDYTGGLHYDVLFGCNMACSRSRFLDLGGFDERVKLAEDNDFCYRWLRAGHRLHYEPSMLIWHHAWRTPEQLAIHFRGYARGQGIFYAKHLRRGDPAVLHFVAQDLRRAARAMVARLVRGRPEWPDARLSLPLGLARGLVKGWREFGGAAPTTTSSGPV